MITWREKLDELADQEIPQTCVDYSFLLRMHPVHARQVQAHIRSLTVTLRRAMPVIETALAAQGDHADPALIDLQHCMASLLPAPAESNPQQPIKTSL